MYSLICEVACYGRHIDWLLIHTEEGATFSVVYCRMKCRERVWLCNLTHQSLTSQSHHRTRCQANFEKSKQAKTAKNEQTKREKEQRQKQKEKEKEGTCPSCKCL